ncbi:MAG: hypothetical protein ACREM9_05955 [Gemmatimonadales bacterium]
MPRPRPHPPATAILLAATALLAASALLGCDAERSTTPGDPPTLGESPAVASGNGLPNNGHDRLYKFNLIGVPREKNPDMTGDAGRRMFVKLEGPSKIYLQPGEFDILDANATDGNGGRFQLPDPDPDDDGETWYGVYIRPVGTPGGSATIGSCVEADFDATLPGDETLCSTETKVLVRGTGKPRAENVSKELLSVCLDTDQIVEANPCDVRSFLFDDETVEYLWNYDNNGLRVAQVYFLEIPQQIGLDP